MGNFEMLTLYAFTIILYISMLCADGPRLHFMVFFFIRRMKDALSNVHFCGLAII